MKHEHESPEEHIEHCPCDLIEIDSLKKAQEDCWLEKQMFSNAFNYSLIGMALVGLDGRWLKVNDAVCEMVGYTREELIQGMTFAELTHPDDIEEDWDLVHEVISGQRFNYTLKKRYYHKNGSIIWVLLGVTLMRDSNNIPLYFISQIQDITDKQSLKEKIIETSKEIRMLINFR